MKLYICSMLTAAALVFVAGIASADIAIGPLTKTIQVSPGEDASVTYKVSNKGDKPVTIDISARTWFSLPENMSIELDQWLKLKKKELTLAPGKEKRFKAQVSVPKNAKGELAAMIYITPKRAKTQTLGTSYGVSLYVFVKGTEQVAPAIGNAMITEREGISYLAVPIENKGNVHFRPRVNATVKVGEFKESIKLPFGKPIFGGKTHVFVGRFEKALPKEGICDIEVFCNYGNTKESVIKKDFKIDLKGVKEKA
ncbi:MAG: hypothetical protein HQ558_05520 [Candidatus Omnitrophica bacterium]|nr:hypothetical protein [Candidatus Omnitrophota bacterium]